MNDVTYRELGRSGLKIAPLVLGGNVFGWTADEQASHAVLDAAVAAGINMIDTADAYSRWVPGHQGGESEAVIGRWLKKSGGLAAEVVARIMEHAFYELDAPVARVCAEEVPIPYAKHMEDAALPQPEKIVAAVKEMLG